MKALKYKKRLAADVAMAALCVAPLIALAETSSAQDQAKPWKAPARASRKKNPIPVNAQSLAAGKGVFIRECASCHGGKGLGDGKAGRELEPLPTDLTTQAVASQSDGALFWMIKTGRAPMPSFKTLLTKDEQWQVINYLRSLQGASGPQATPPKFKAPDAFRAATSRVFGAYTKLRESIFKSDADGAVRAIDSLLKTVKSIQSDVDAGGLDQTPQKAWNNDLEAILAEAMALSQSAAEMPSMRKRFSELSQTVVKLTSHFGHAEKAPLLVFTSEAAYLGSQAIWLQAGASPNDPYMGRAPKANGSPTQALGGHQ